MPLNGFANKLPWPRCDLALATGDVLLQKGRGRYFGCSPVIRRAAFALSTERAFGRAPPVLPVSQRSGLARERERLCHAAHLKAAQTYCKEKTQPKEKMFRSRVGQLL